MKIRSSCTLLGFAILLSAFHLPAKTNAAAPQEKYVGANEPKTAGEIYGQGVRETDWQTPEQEKSGFHLPPGFEAKLFADESLVSKPLNMAWDARGRLWVTCTVEYPYPAKEGTVPRDTIRILEDTDGDGQADKVTTFADKLNIPMGLLPVADGVICFSIPNIWYLKDTDGDDRVDERVKLLGPFDTTRDTHGMVSSLSRGSDGWIYACHGFNNQSHVQASDGSSVSLISGNTFRFKADGSSIEQYTQGQVNPFGMTRDQWGNWYTADCHSKPLTALLAGACYPSFGRPHDGLGFTPDMMEHLHGSTAICGLNYYQAEHYPAPYRHLFYSGNVMTSRINCNAPKWRGVTVTAVEQPDFMTSDDPWFRPVDIQLGPDGQLYIADFYNKIIGHYEVPLEHPERDRESGRIWRIEYTGDAPHAPAKPLNNVHLALQQDNLAALADPNLTYRRLAIDTFVHSSRPALSDDQATQMVIDGDQPSLLRQSLLECLHRRRTLLRDTLLTLLKTDAPSELHVLALKLASDQGAETAAFLYPTTRQLLAQSTEPQVQKAAVEMLSNSGQPEDVQLLLQLAVEKKSEDTILTQAARIATRKLLRSDDLLKRYASNWLGLPASQVDVGADPALSGMLVGILPGLNSEVAAAALLGYVSEHSTNVEPALFEQAIEAASKQASNGLNDKLLAAIDRITAGNVTARAAKFKQLATATIAKHSELSPRLMAYGLELQNGLLDELNSRTAATGRVVDWIDDRGKVWGLEPRDCDDGQAAQLVSSLSQSEQYTGILRSEVIACPAELTFWLSGHNGAPDLEDHRRNVVKLIHATTGEVIAEAFPPRNDRAKRVAWALSDFENQPVRIEVIDADAGDAYAWLAVGRFSDSRLERGNIAELIEAISANLLQRVQPENLASRLNALPLSPRQRATLIASALTGTQQQPLAALAQQAIALRRAELVDVEWLATDFPAEKTEAIVNELCATATASQQTGFAKALLGSASGCKLLSELLAKGTLSLRALQSVEALLPANLDGETKRMLTEQLAAAATLPPETVDVAARLGRLNWESATTEAGQQVYKQHCAACHKLGNEGTLVGPQLDGALVRGAERLGEDILDPNRNVDRAFRVTALLLDDDSVVTGLVRDSEDGQTVTITGQDGKSQEIPANTIADRRESTQSLMPSNFTEILNDEQLAALLKFLSR